MDANVQEEQAVCSHTRRNPSLLSSLSLSTCRTIRSEADSAEPFVSHPATPSVSNPRKRLSRPSQTQHRPPEPPPPHRGPRSPRWATPRSRPRLELRTLQQAPEGGAVIPSFFTYPVRTGAWGLTREPAAFRNAETLLQIPTTLGAAIFLKQAHCAGTHNVTSVVVCRQVKQTRTGFALAKHGRPYCFHPPPTPHPPPLIHHSASIGSLRASYPRHLQVCPRAPTLEANRNLPLPLLNMAAASFRPHRWIVPPGSRCLPHFLSCPE